MDEQLCAACADGVHWHVFRPCLRQGCVCDPWGDRQRGGDWAAPIRISEAEARDSIENLWDRATPVGPLLDAYRAAILNSAADRFAAFDRPEEARMLRRIATRSVPS